jgi:Nif-specific regulatory protein
LEDVADLARHFLGKLCARMETAEPPLTGKALQLLGRHRWPGNIRELRNLIERALVLDRDGILDSDDFQIPAGEIPVTEDAFANRGYREAVNSFKRKYLADALRLAGGSRVVAARRLKLQRTYLSRLLKQHGVD